MIALKEKRRHTVYSPQKHARKYMRCLLRIVSRSARLCATGQRRGAAYRAPLTLTAAACCDELVPIELTPAGMRHRRRRHRRAQRVAVARIDRACDAHAAQAARACETIGDDATRFCERSAVWFSCDDVTRSRCGERIIFVHASRRCCCYALGFEAATSNFAREVGSRLEIGRDRRRRSFHFTIYII